MNIDANDLSCLVRGLLSGIVRTCETLSHISVLVVELLYNWMIMVVNLAQLPVTLFALPADVNARPSAPSLKYKTRTIRYYSVQTTPSSTSLSYKTTRHHTSVIFIPIQHGAPGAKSDGISNPQLARYSIVLSNRSVGSGHHVSIQFIILASGSLLTLP
jgi:hypothetical protein